MLSNNQQTRKPSFSGGGDVPYATLPVECNYMRWVRGDSKLSSLVTTDPAAYFGGWRAKVKTYEGNPLPTLPLPIVERTSQDGTKTFEVYTTPVIRFLPIQHRTRFELRGEKIDPNTGRKRKVVLTSSTSRIKGYQPNKQIFGFVYDKEGNSAPAVLIVDNWSAYITFQKADGLYGEVKGFDPTKQAMIRCYGTQGKKDDKTPGRRFPEFEQMGESLSTPIRAIGLDKPTFIDITDEMTKLFYESIDWAECKRWNADNLNAEAFAAEDATAKTKFLAACDVMQLDATEIEQLLAEAQNDYSRALDMLGG